MENLMLQIGLFAIATFVLVRSADYFIDYAEKIGKALRLPAFLVGVIVVALGTSLPELSTGVASVLKDETDMLVGNVLGSNVANVFLGLGGMVVLANRNLKFKQNIFKVHFPTFVMASVALVLLAWDKEITRSESIIFWLIGLAYLWFLLGQKDQTSVFQKKEPFKVQYVLFLILSLCGVLVSSELIIRSIIEIASILGLGKTALAASVVAIGTSLPEMMVVFAALKKNQAEMAVGNILGSNIFNILLILGVGASIKDLQLSEQSFTVLLPFAIATFFVYWASSQDKEITKQEGLAMVALYGLFLGKIYGFL